MQVVVVSYVAFHSRNCGIVEKDASHVAMDEQALDQQFRRIAGVVGITNRHGQALMIMAQRPDIYMKPMLVALVWAHVTSLRKANITDSDLHISKVELELSTDITQRLDARSRTILPSGG
jgi:hypothetical protein